MKLVFFGTPNFAAQIADTLMTQGVEIVACVSAPDAPVGRKQILSPSAVSEWAARHNIPVLKPQKVKDAEFQQELQSFPADAWLVVAYGKILPQSFLDLMPGKVINIHPSILPKYRGPAPMQAALRHGDSITGTTLMVMDRKMDHGPIIGQIETSLSPDETYPELAHRMVDLCATLVMDFLPRYLSGEIDAIEQEHDKATYVSLLQKSDGQIDWADSAENIYNQHRAYTPWPGTFGYLGTTKVDLIFSGYDQESQLGAGEWTINGDSMCIGTGKGQVLVSQVKQAGKLWWNVSQVKQAWGEKGKLDLL